jgi:hypothetical protein
MLCTYVLAQTYTEARKEAIKDPRTFINFAAMCEVVVHKPGPRIFVNGDAMSVEVERDKDNKIVWHCHNKGDKLPVRRSGTGGMCVYIKEVNLVCSNGDVSDSVYVIQDKSMEKNDCLHYTVLGLSSSQISGSQGHIFIMESRSPNHRFMELYNEKVLFPFFDTIRLTDHCSRMDSVEPDDNNSRDTPIVYFLDGEDQQLDIYRSDEVADRMKFERVTIVKLPPSATSKTQPLDVGKKHDSKKKSIRANTEVHIDERLTRTFKMIFRKHPNINTPTRDLLIYGLHACNQADQECLDRNKITLGWRDSGLVPFDPIVILNNCERLWREGEIELVLAKLEEYGDHFLSHGSLSDAKMDEDNMPLSENPKYHSRDDFVDYRQRCLIMNHQNVIEARIAYEDNREAANERKAAMKIINDAVSAENYNNIHAGIVRGDNTWKHQPKTYLTQAYKHLKLVYTRPLGAPPKLREDLADLLENLIKSTFPPQTTQFHNLPSNSSTSMAHTSG